jgi:hypothetical protein
MWTAGSPRALAVRALGFGYVAKTLVRREEDAVPISSNPGASAVFRKTLLAQVARRE